MQSHQQYIAVATEPDTVSLPPFAPLTEWGLFGAVAYLVVKEAVGWFREKETGETNLISSLIANQQRVMERLLEVQQGQHTDFMELKSAIISFGEKLDRAVESQNRAIAQIQAQLDLLRPKS